LEATFLLGVKYQYGIGVRQDYSKALHHLIPAAVRRDFDAAHSVATIYLKQKNQREAYAWLSLYADEDPQSKDAASDVWRKSADRSGIERRARELKEWVLDQQAALLLREVHRISR
jgi:TPR repeat protein